jgi:hypothetical protein
MYISKVFGFDWDKFDYKNKEHQKKLSAAMQCFMSLPSPIIPAPLAQIQEFVDRHDKHHGKIQEFTLYSDGPANEKAIDTVRRLHFLTDYDRGFEQIFDTVDFTGTKANGFDVEAAASGLAFAEVKPGEKAKVYQMAGGKYRTYFCYYAAALGWHRQLFEDGEWWTIDKNAIEFRNKAYSNYAATYYALLETAADTVGCCRYISSDCSGCDATARGDAESLNFAALSILLNTANRGYGITPQTARFIVLTPLQLWGRMQQALRVVNQPFSGSPQIASYNFQLIPTTMLTNTGRVMVIMPKQTLIIGNRMDLTLFDDFDILSYTDTVAGWMRHGGSIGDLDQISCIEMETVTGSCPNTNDAPIAGCGDVVDENGTAVTELPQFNRDFTPAAQ